jgi:hypothetical protein
MGLSRVLELLSQSEREDISLGVLISREMTEEEIAAAQEDLKAALDKNYASIEDFMADVEVPSLEDALSQYGMSSDRSGDTLSDEMANEG